ncbi:MAG: porin [Planctomycetota bacterium]|jgi:porin
MHTTTNCRLSFLIVLLSASAIGQDQSSHGLLPIRTHGGALTERAFLTGDWGGVRDRLVDRGIRYDLLWTQTMQDVTSGGKERGAEYGGKFEMLFNFDLDRMELLRGGLVTMRTESRYGDSVNQKSGALLAVNDVMFFPDTDGADDDLFLAVTELRYTQFLSKHLGVFLGKIITLGGDVNEFASGRGDTQFLSHSFLASSVTALVNPYSALGAGVVWMPSPDITVTSSIFTRNDASTTTGTNELSDGLTWSTAARMQYELSELPGGMNLAFQYSFDSDFTNFEGQFVDSGAWTIPQKEQSWNSFWNMWQYMSVEDPSHRKVDVTNGHTDLQGYGFFARAGIADRDTNPVSWSLSAGVGGRGMFDGRDDDTFGVGFASSKLRENLLTSSTLIDDSASRWEAYYDFAITPAVSLTLDVQYADTLLSNVDAATVLGVRMRVSL